jgi:hypothetical protein
LIFIARAKNQKSLFGLLALRFQAVGADLQILSTGFLGLKIDRHRSFRGNVGMGTALGGFGSAAADLADSAHIFQ